MLETSARLLRLLALLQARRDWSGPELADRLEVDVRTVRRDVDRLRTLGYPVDASTGLGGGYKLAAGRTMPPLLLDDEETVAVAVALRAATSSVARLEQTAMRALVKLEQLLPARLRRRVNALQSITVALRNPDAGPDAATLVAIAGACRDHETLAFGYEDRSGTPSRREVEPVHLVHTERRWYLVAWDLGRAAWRTFRVDRLHEPTSTGTGFAPRPLPEDVVTYVSRSISEAPYRHRAQLRLQGSAKTLARRFTPWCGVLEDEGPSTCILRLGADTVEMLLGQIVMLGVDFELIAPLELAPRLHEVAARISRAAPRAAPPQA